jgi:hypothetical protein
MADSSLHLATILQVFDSKRQRQVGPSRVISQVGDDRLTELLLRLSLACGERTVLEESNFAITGDLRVVGQANVEKTGVFSRSEGVQVVKGRSHVQYRLRLNGHQAGSLSFD